MTQRKLNGVACLGFSIIYIIETSPSVSHPTRSVASRFFALRVSAIIVSDFARDMNGKNYKKSVLSEKLKTDFIL